MYTMERSKQMSDDEAHALAGTLLTDDSYDWVVQEDCDIIRPDGEPLIIYRSKAFTLEECRAAHRGLRDAARPSKNRGMAAGVPTTDAKDDTRGEGRLRLAPVGRWHAVEHA